MRKRLFVGVLFAVLAGCSHGSSGVLPAGSSLPITPQSVSPGTIPAAPMAKTTILPASAMQSPPKSDTAVLPLNWMPIPGTASVVAASPDGSLWVLSDQPSGPDKYIWHYSGGSWTNISGLASNLSVAADGSLWALNSAGGIWHYSGGTWTSPGGGATNSITADASNGIYVLSNGGSGADRAIWHYSPSGGWTQLLGSGTALAANWDTNNFTPGAGVSGPINAGGVYILSSSGSIWYENANQSFAQVPGAASGIAPTTKGGFFVLGYPVASGGNQVYYYDLDTPGFTAQNGAGLLSISAGPSALYLTSSSGSIYSAAATEAVSTAIVTGPSSSAFGSVTIGTPKTITLTVTEQDVNGKTIRGTYDTPVTLSNLDNTGATSLNVTTVSSSSTSVTLTYNGSSAFAGTRIRASVGGTVTGSFLVVGPCTTTGSAGRSGLSGYYPCDLQSAYNLAASSAAGGGTQTVAIVDAYDDPTAESDLAIYRSAFGLPACTTANGCFKKRAQDGTTSYPVPDAGWAGEISLDIDMVSAICPNCHILLVEATTDSTTNLYAAENEAATLGATEISNSWGLNENVLILAAEKNFNHPGIPITASSGDNAYAGGVSYPASSQYVTAVGGTTLMAATGNRGWSETAWGTSTPDTGTGSGCSQYISKPSWQIDGGCTNRMVADVSAVADPATAVWTYDTYQSSGNGTWVRVGGTSASSPIIASVYAISGNASSVVAGSYPYAHTSWLYDITSGNNGNCNPDPLYYCTAAAGYDGPTGLGTPNGATGAFIQPLETGREQPAPFTGLNYHPGPTRALCPDEFRPGYARCFAIVRTD